MSDPIRVVRTGTFIPHWGNEDREDDQKIVMHYRFLSFAEQQELLAAEDIKTGAFTYETKILGKMITKIDNLSVEESGKVKEIATGHDLISEPALDELAMEAWLEIRKRSAVDKKK